MVDLATSEMDEYEDMSGVDYAQKLTGLLFDGGAESVRNVNLPGLPDKGDVEEWCEAGGNQEKWNALLEDAKYEEKPTDALTERQILYDAITNLEAGDSGARWETPVLEAARKLEEENPRMVKIFSLHENAPICC